MENQTVKQQFDRHKVEKQFESNLLKLCPGSGKYEYLTVFLISDWAATLRFVFRMKDLIDLSFFMDPVKPGMKPDLLQVMINQDNMKTPLEDVIKAQWPKIDPEAYKLNGKFRFSGKCGQVGDVKRTFKSCHYSFIKARLHEMLIFPMEHLYSDWDLLSNFMGKTRSVAQMNACLNLGGPDIDSPEALKEYILLHNMNPSFAAWDHVRWIKFKQKNVDDPEDYQPLQM